MVLGNHGDSVSLPPVLYYSTYTTLSTSSSFEPCRFVIDAQTVPPLCNTVIPTVQYCLSIKSFQRTNNESHHTCTCKFVSSYCIKPPSSHAYSHKRQPVRTHCVLYSSAVLPVSNQKQDSNPGHTYNTACAWRCVVAPDLPIPRIRSEVKACYLGSRRVALSSHPPAPLTSSVE